MNYLAHAFLSFGHPAVLAGNMISDFVKGKKKFEYAQDIQAGITLHRFIDKYTDEHPATKKAKEIFRPVYRLYAGAFVDVVYDHFLACDEKEFFTISLADFTRNTYAALDSYTTVFPEIFQSMYPFMKSQNWLYNYRFTWGVEKSFNGLVRRSKYLAESKEAFRLFEKHHEHLGACYREFFPGMKYQAEKKFSELLSEIPGDSFPGNGF